MSVFNEEQTIRRPVTVVKRAWPIRLAMKLGAKTDAQASLVVLSVVLLLLVAAIFIYQNNAREIRENFPPTLEDLTDQQIYELLNRGVNTENLPPETKEELRRRGFDV